MAEKLKNFNYDSLSEEDLQRKLEEGESAELTEEEKESKKLKGKQEQKNNYKPKWPGILNKETEQETGVILTKKEAEENRESRI